MAKEKFKYRAPDPSKVKEHSEQSGGSFDSILKQGFDMFRPKNGENTIRILPPTFKDFEYWGLEIWVHNRIGSDESSYLCPNKMRGKDCPICEAAEETSKAGEKEEARGLKANKRFLVWLIDRDEKKPMPLAYSMSWSMDRDITALVHNKKSGKILLIDHPDDGMDVTFMKSGAGLKTKYYGYQIERETSPISDNERRQNETLEYIKENPLDEILNFFTADYLAKVLEGKAEKKDDLDDDEDAPKKKRRRDDDDEEAAPKRKARDADDEEEDDPPKKKKKPTDDDEDEDAPRPRKRDAEDNDEEAEAKSSRRRARDEDEDEDDPPKKKKKVVEDEDDDEFGTGPAPKKRRREPDEDEEEEKGSKRRRQYAEDEEEDDPPKKKKKVVDDEEEEEPRSKRRRPADDEEEEDDKPAKRVRAK